MIVLVWAVQIAVLRFWWQLLGWFSPFCLSRHIRGWSAS